MGKSIFFLLAVFGLIFSTLANCPDMTFRCPTGERFTVGTCWSWSHFNCQTCRSIMHEVRRKCRQYSCRGSTYNWYNRNDGCSVGPISGVMTGVFRAPCAIHDICYATPGRTQLQCDIDFRTNMLKNCEMPGIGSIGYPFCALTAAAAYRAVRNHGHNFPDFARSCVEV